MLGSGRRKIADIINEPAKKQKITIFLICLFCSAVFWFFIRLSGENQAGIRQTIRVVDLLPGTMVLDHGDHGFLSVFQVSGVRSFFSVNALRGDTLQVGQSMLSRMTRNEEEVYYITAPALAGLLSRRVDPGASVIRIMPDTVFFVLARKTEKKVAVRYDLAVSFERRYGLYGAHGITPDSVLIIGPESIIDTISFVNAGSLELTGLSQTESRRLDILPVSTDRSVQIVPDFVSLHVPVEEFTESRVEVSLDVVCPDSLLPFERERLRLFPERVNMVFLVALRDYQKIDPELFSAYVECPAPDFSGKQLPVFTGHAPDFVRMESVRPASVDFLIMN